MSAPERQLSDDAREAAAAWCLRLANEPLGEADRHAFEAWIASDAAHQALFERTVSAWTAIERQAAQPEMLNLRGEALKSMRRAGARRWRLKASAWRNALAIAACLVIMVAAGGWWRYAPTRYVTGVGERRVVALADGSSLSLDAQTRVDVRYGKDRRQLWLRQGRAKFTVAKDALRPFSVEAGDRMVVATGTLFTVERIVDEVRVVLYQGHVAVLDVGRDAPRPLLVGPRRMSAEQALTPGHQLIVANDAPPAPAQTGAGGIGATPHVPTRVDAVDLDRSLGWETGLLQFADEPLASAVERMNRYGAQRLRVEPATGRRITISGQFEGENTGGFIEGVTALFPLKAVRAADGTLELRGDPSRDPGATRKRH